MTTTIPSRVPELFAFTEEHNALRSVLRDFYAATSTLAAGPRWHRLLTEVGVDGVILGGESDSTAVELAILAEESGAALFGGPVWSTVALGALAGVDQTWAPVAVEAGRGRRQVAVALPGAGPTALTVEGNATGSVTPVWDCAGADLVIVAASRHGEPVLAGITAAAAGVELTELSGLDLSRQVGRLVCRNASADLLSGGAQAVTALAAARIRTDLVVSAELLGVAQRALDGTVEYVSQRVQFGRTIGSFQAIKHRLADLLAQVELARSAVYGAAWQIDEMPLSAQAEIDLAVAAVLARDAATAITKATVQLHGGIAITWEHWAHQYLRRAHAVTVLTGPAAAHRRRLAALLRGGSTAEASEATGIADV